LCASPNIAVLGKGRIFIDNKIGGIGQHQAIAEMEKCHFELNDKFILQNNVKFNK